MNTTERKPIELTMNGVDLMMLMSEGNPGAVSVLAMLLKDPMEGFMHILNLDDMNIRGTQIWVGYKDYCKQDIAMFKKLVGERDHKMIAHINSEGMRGNHPHKAIPDGGSYPGGRQMLK